MIDTSKMRELVCVYTDGWADMTKSTRLVLLITYVCTHFIGSPMWSLGATKILENLIYFYTVQGIKTGVQTKKYWNNNNIACHKIIESDHAARALVGIKGV